MYILLFLLFTFKYQIFHIYCILLVCIVYLFKKKPKKQETKTKQNNPQTLQKQTNKQSKTKQTNIKSKRSNKLTNLYEPIQ